MRRRAQSGRRPWWVVMLPAVLAAFSFHTGTCAPPAHPAVPATSVVVLDADDDPWDDPDLTDDIPGDDQVATALGRKPGRGAASVFTRCIRTPDVWPWPCPDQATGPDQVVRPRNLRPAESGAALLTRLGVSLT